MSLKEIMLRAENEELDTDQIRTICNARIVSYHELRNIRSLRELLGKDGEVIILYETSQRNVGHWTCIFSNEFGIQFFDPYGLRPDEELRWNTFDETPYLTRLIKADGRPIYWNNHDLQSKHEDVNTCGRHAAMRLRWKRLDHEHYFHVMTSMQPELTPDNVVTMLTYVALNDDRHLLA